MPSVSDIFLATHRAAVLDGGLATELERRGADISGALWSAALLVSQPELIRSVHEEYLAAGAQIITAAGYQASLQGFALQGIADGKRYLRRSVELAAQARENFMARSVGQAKPLVAASAGNFGAFRADGSEYHGRYGVSARDIAEVHARHVEIYAETEADLLCFETVPSAREAEAICRVMEQFPEIPWWAAFTARDASHIADGTPTLDVAAMVREQPGAVAFGFNCLPPGLVAPLLESCGRHERCGFAVYPNLGAAWDPETRKWSGGKQGFQTEFAAKWADAGAVVIGGCCGTTPQNIRQLEQCLRLR